MELLLALAVLGLVLYGIGVVRQRRRGVRWSRWRSASFLAGAGLIVGALTPPLAGLGHADLRVHMVQHLMLGMLGPVGVVLGAPVTLLLRNLPVTRARQLVAVLRSRPVHVLGHPVTALILNVGGMAALYATPLFAWMMADPRLHLAVHLHFLLAGCLFAWAIAGPDPGPARPSHAARLAVLFVAIAAHATLGKAMYAYGWPRGTAFTAAEIEQAAQIMYYGGDLAELLLAIALFARWPRGGRWWSAPGGRGRRWPSARRARAGSPAPAARKLGAVAPP